MTRDEFWAMIGLLRRDHIDLDFEDDEPDPVTSPLIEALSRLPEAEIRSFDDHMCELLYDLDGRPWALAAGVCGDFDDLFLYCRCVAVGSGREVYDAILAEPALMPEGMEFERLLEVPGRAFRQKTKRDYDHVPPFDLERGANRAQWE